VAPSSIQELDASGNPVPQDQSAPEAQPTPASLVILQYPAPGQKVAGGTMVSFEVR